MFRMCYTRKISFLLSTLFVSKLITNSFLLSFLIIPCILCWDEQLLFESILVCLFSQFPHTLFHSFLQITHSEPNQQEMLNLNLVHFEKIQVVTIPIPLYRLTNHHHHTKSKKSTYFSLLYSHTISYDL